MIASFLFGFSEKEILKLGIFINLFGIIGCLSLGKIEDRVGSEKIVLTCIIFLLLITFTLYFINDTKIFWLLSLMIGFFIGPIQAASRSVLAKKLKSENQLSAFCVYSMFGNICSILGPFLVSLVISISSDIRQGLLVIPLFFVISLLPFVKTNV
jgi:UMF1 family MFS transporter